MKQCAGVLIVSLTITSIVNIFGCSPAYVKTQQNEFFTPVDKLPHKNPNLDSLSAGTVRTTADTDDRLKDSLLVLYRHQNKRLNELNRQLNLLTVNDQKDSSRAPETFTENLLDSGQISNALLLEKIRNQNQQLNEIIDKLKSLSLKRQDQIGEHAASVQSPASHQVPGPADGARSVPARNGPLPQASVPKKNTPSLNYGTAIQLYKERQYIKAINAFEQLLNRKIEPALADRYHFWMGVCYFNLNKGKLAIHEFKDVLGFRKSEKAEEAHFMMGQCYERMGEKKSARTSYETVLRLYPHGTMKQIAEKKLTLLK